MTGAGRTTADWVLEAFGLQEGAVEDTYTCLTLAITGLFDYADYLEAQTEPQDYEEDAVIEARRMAGALTAALRVESGLRKRKGADAGS